MTAFDTWTLLNKIETFCRYMSSVLSKEIGDCDTKVIMCFFLMVVC